MTQYVRFEYRGKTGYGIKNGGTIDVLDRNFPEDAKPTGEQLQLADVRLLSPVVPPNIICIGLNYKPHAAEFGRCRISNQKASPRGGVFPFII